ncbi:MAG: Nucleoside triphosphate pyrophosphohydrolase MazG [Clostridiales bacterium 38_11]|nr:MAG: Nucleoside triphosphate pyrophosphohydrolase MazG [Clostridiales bacterium 38_11]HBH13628.1 nucleoside triphosphate pyrophosphohydrolase [Clostridiales bacterium]
MHKLQIVGLGTGNLGDLSYKAYTLINSEKPKFARTIRHPVLLENSFKNLQAFDEIFEQEDNLEKVYETIKNRIDLALEKHGEIIYIVPGSPYIGDWITDSYMSRVNDLVIEIIDGPSFVDKAIKMTGSQNARFNIIDGHKVGKYDFDIHSNNIICGVENQALASKIKIELTEIYPDDMNVFFMDILKNKREQISLFELDRQQNYDYSTYIFVESIDITMLDMYNINDLKNLMILLRGPDGCPWDRKQTHMSLRECVIEEAYEVVDAIENDDLDNLVEELGDLLLQVVFHSQIAAEEGYFHFEDVIAGICKKLYARHPHVFRDEHANDDTEAKLNWDEIKQKEKKVSSYTERISNIPKSMSPLSRGYKIQSKVAEVGFDWPDASGAVLKVKEEIEELMEAYQTMDTERIEDELGDLIFAIINFARFMKINPDIALSRANKKFIRRFEFIEKNSPKDLKDMTLEEMDYLWELSKRH